MPMLLCASLPILAGIILPLFRRKRNARMTFCVGSALCTSLALLSVLLSDKTYSLELFRLSDSFVCSLFADGSSKLFLALIAFLWPLAMLYAAEYMRHSSREGFFFSFYLITYGVTILTASSSNLFSLYVFYELLTLVTVPLVMHEKDSPSIRATRLYLRFLFGGASLGFVAMILLIGAGAGEFQAGGHLSGTDSPVLLYAAAPLAFFGFGVKAALFPLCRWLPRASVAPTPVTALLHAVAVVNAGVFAVMRVLYFSIGADFLRDTPVQYAMLAVCAFTIVFGAVMAVRENHLKRRLAWSTVSNLSYMLFGLCLLSAEGLSAALLHMVNHGLMKIILFFCAGAIMIQTNRTQVRQLHGLAHAMPVTFAAFTLAGLALMGIPPLPGFASKYALITAGLHIGNPWALCGCIALLTSAVLTSIYILTTAIPAYFLPQDTGIVLEKRDPGRAIRFALIAVCVVMVIVGLFSGALMDTISAMTGGCL